MASIYTDAVRRARYDKLRSRKKLLEKLYDVLMYPAIILTVGVLLGSLIALVLGGAFGNLSAIIQNILNFAAAVGTIIALYQHKWKITLGALLFSLIVPISNSGLHTIAYPFLLSLALVIDIMWAKLQKEEGFPHFEIPLEEYDQRAKQGEKIIRGRAIAAGNRIAAFPETACGIADMGDIADDDANIPMAPAKLTGYHERARENAAPGTQCTAQRNAEMDEFF